MKIRTDVKTKKKSKWQLYLMLSPSLIYLLIFCYVPMLGLLIAFKNYSPSLGFEGIFTSEWVGFKHFKNFFEYPYFWDIMGNTLELSFYALIINTILPIVLALMINEVRNKPFKTVFQTVSYAPYFVSLVVLVGICGSFLQGDNSVLNVIRSAFGLPSVNVMSNPDLFSTIYTFSGLWQGWGWWTIIYVGTLSNVDRTLHEAAAIDGAGRLRRIFTVNLPAILPTATIQFILAMGSMMSIGFEKVYMFQNLIGDLTLGSTEIISTFVYRVAFVQSRNFGFATAVGLFNSVINIILLVSTNFLSKKITKESLW